jgi:hypothetical protein
MGAVWTGVKQATVNRAAVTSVPAFRVCTTTTDIWVSLCSLSHTCYPGFSEPMRPNLPKTSIAGAVQP